MSYMENLHEQNGSSPFVTPKRPIKRRKEVSENSKYKGIAETEKNKAKIRTPSGQVINTSVKDIRNFFTTDSLSTTVGTIKFGQSQPSVSSLSIMHEGLTNVNVNAESMYVTGQSDSDYENNQDEWSVVKAMKGAKLKERFNDMFVQVNQNKQLKALSDENRYAYLMPDQSSVDESENERESQLQTKYDYNLRSKQRSTEDVDANYEATMEAASLMTNSQNANASTGYKTISQGMKQTVTTVTDNEKQVMQTPGMKKDQQKTGGSGKKGQKPQLMDVQIVMKMFGELKQQLKEISDGNTVRDTTMAAIESTRLAEKEEVIKLRREVKNYKRKNDILSGVVERLGNLCVDMDKRMDLIESRNMRRHIVFTGLETDNKMKKCSEQIAQFCNDKLKYEIEVIDCFKLGVGVQKPVVVMVNSMSQKHGIFQAMDAYRKLCEEKEEVVDVYINDYLTAEVKEKRRREREIFKKNEQEQQSVKVDMNMTKGGLQILGEPYNKKVEAPHPTKVLQYSEAELNRICSMKIRAGDVQQENKSEFQAFVLPTNNSGDINDFYMKLRLLFPQAKHIVCAYDIPGMPRVLHQDYCDDKENGAGSFLLNLLKRNNLTHIAVFVVRMQHGAKLGRARFDMMKRAVHSALKAFLYNSYIGAQQNIVIDDGKRDATLESFKEKQRKMKTRAKYHRGQSKQIRGSTRAMPNSQRQKRNEHNPEKRRRESSPTQTPWDSEYDYHFDFQPPTDAFSMKHSHENSLGGSWPTLQQAQSGK